MSENKATRTVVVTDPSGVHARTAVAIAEMVRRGRSQVTLTKIRDQQTAVGTEVLQILTLVLDPGESVVLEAQGPDADEVLSALELLFAEPPNENP